jgi:hypothetical protein
MRTRHIDLLRQDARRLAGLMTHALREAGDGPAALRLSSAEVHAYALVRDLTAVLHGPIGPCCAGGVRCAVHDA